MLHRPAAEVGLYYLAVMSGVPIGSFASSRLASWVRLSLLLRATSAIAMLGATLFFLVALIGTLTVTTVLGPMILFSIGIGAASPVAITSAISTDARMIGAASGLYGFMQMANGALCTLAVGYFPANPAISAASVLLAGTLLDQYFFRLPENDGPAARQNLSSPRYPATEVMSHEAVRHRSAGPAGRGSALYHRPRRLP
jgi:DHA1 family bicyclomycin/chloramphenicol resistance-like MFS transporter